MRRRDNAGAAEQRDAPVGAPGLKMLYDTSSFINVRPAGDPGCSPDSKEQPLERRPCNRQDSRSPR